jgi:hypothetical protein
MPKIIFTATPDLPRDIVHLGYRKGHVVKLSPDSCQRWIRRGVATFFVDAPIVEPAPVEVAAPEAAVEEAVAPAAPKHWRSRRNK